MDSIFKEGLLTISFLLYKININDFEYQFLTLVSNEDFFYTKWFTLTVKVSHKIEIYNIMYKNFEKAIKNFITVS